MKRTRNGILIPDVPIMAGGNLPNAVKGVSAGSDHWSKHIVDMGLPSGTLWADCDIDATMPKGLCLTPFIYEKTYFSWGNIDGHNPVAGSFDYSWDTSNYSQTKGAGLVGNIPTNDEYDAARANLGDPWQMPSLSDFEELIENSIRINESGEQTSEYIVSVQGVNGMYLQSKINGNRIFIAASGYGESTVVREKSITILIWGKDQDGTKGGAMRVMNEIRYAYYNKSYGLPIRPVVKL